MAAYESEQVLAEKAQKIFDEIKTKNLTPKERMAIPPQEMPTREPKQRATEMDEVALGYTATEARVEAARCLGCKNRPCVAGCPVGVMIPEFIKEIQDGNFEDAVQTIKKTNLLPAICGRVCPQEKQVCR